jgi:hypothetical protein
VLENDLGELFGFTEPVLAYHGNQFFKAQEIWDRICDLPVLQKLDLKLWADLWAAKDKLQEAGWHADRRWWDEGLLRQWLSSLHVTSQETRHTAPCVAKLRGGIFD